MNNSSSQTIIGAQEWCSLPDLSVPLIKAHINSCIPISCLRVYNLQTVTQDNVLHVRYDIKPLQHNLSVRVPCQSVVIDRTRINNTRCFVVNTSLKLDELKTTIKVALITHDINDYRCNLSPDAVSTYLVDLNRKCLFGKKKPQELKDSYGCLLYTSPSPRDRG